MRRGVVVAVGDDAVARGVESVRDARAGWGEEKPMARVQRAPARRLRARMGTEGAKAGCVMLISGELSACAGRGKCVIKRMRYWQRVPCWFLNKLGAIMRA